MFQPYFLEQNSPMIMRVPPWPIDKEVKWLKMTNNSLLWLSSTTYIYAYVCIYTYIIYIYTHNGSMLRPSWINYHHPQEVSPCLPWVSPVYPHYGWLMLANSYPLKSLKSIQIHLNPVNSHYYTNSSHPINITIHIPCAAPCQDASSASSSEESGSSDSDETRQWSVSGGWKGWCQRVTWFARYRILW